MALLLDERSVIQAAEVLLSNGPLAVECQITVEWLRGVEEPTWYGYLLPHDPNVYVLPGRYWVRLGEEPFVVLVRRPVRLADALCFPYWGLGSPPPIGGA
ncbi:MAG: hypothetical protein U0531_01725 [Dehalococcoidia bacterium]